MINPIGIQKHVGKKWTVVLAVLSFIIPLAVWSVVSYVPFVYHPLVKVVDAGGSMFASRAMKSNAPILKKRISPCWPQAKRR